MSSSKVIAGRRDRAASRKRESRGGGSSDVGEVTPGFSREGTATCPIDATPGIDVPPSDRKGERFSGRADDSSAREGRSTGRGRTR